MPSAGRSMGNAHIPVPDDRRYRRQMKGQVSEREHGGKWKWQPSRYLLLPRPRPEMWKPGIRSFRRALLPSVRFDLLATSRQGQRNDLGRAAWSRRRLVLLPRPLQGNLALVVASRFRNR